MRKFLKKEFKSFEYAFSGLFEGFAKECHLKIHATIALFVIIAGALFQISTTEWCLALFAIGLVISTELINSAIEQLVNLVEPKQNPQAGKVKDLAAAAVLFASIVSASIGIIIFIPKVFLLFV